MTEQEDGPITMVGLLWFDPDGGRETYEKYIAAGKPILERHLGTQFVSQSFDRKATVAGELEPDLVAINDFPSEAAFMAAIQDPDYPAELLEKATTRVEVFQIRRG